MQMGSNGWTNFGEFDIRAIHRAKRWLIFRWNEMQIQ